MLQINVEDQIILVLFDVVGSADDCSWPIFTVEDGSSRPSRVAARVWEGVAARVWKKMNLDFGAEV